MKPKVLVLADVPGWAWDRKGQQYVNWLSDDFDVTLAYHANMPDPKEFDLVHLFEVSQLRAIPADFHRPVVAGLTAMVWWTWGAEKMHAWAAQCVGLHGNSIQIVDELQNFHGHVYYTPNGVDPVFWGPQLDEVHNRHKSRLEFVACHVGKPNPRKGSALIIEACRRADVKLLLCQRTSQIKLLPEEIRELYWKSNVQICASDMDGTPNPMLEAASCCNALISTPIGNMPEFITPENGFLVGESLMPKPFKPWVVQLDENGREKLISEIQEKVEHLRDHRSTCSEMGMEARKTVLSQWSWAKTTERVGRMWTDCLERYRY